MDFLLDAGFTLAIAMGLVIAIAALAGLLGLPRLLPAPDAGDLPPVSIVVPVRDEEARLEETVRRILAQRGVAIQLTVVDDRSTDRTPQILASIEDPRLHVERVDDLPDGWIGKNHACAVGASRSRHEWLLFMDADSWCGETVVRDALAVARQAGADHYCLLPGLGSCTLAGKGIVLLSSLALLVMVAGINRDLWFGYFGIGSFTLIRRDAYDAVGGHAGLALEVVEDLMLGKRVRDAGLRSRIHTGQGELEVRWAHSARSFVAVLEKNLFASMQFSVPQALARSIGLLLFWAVPLVGLATRSWLGFAAASAMLASGVPAMWMARRYGWSPFAGCLAPLMAPVLAYAILNSMLQTLRRGGVSWRDTLYPLDRLRAAQRA